MMLLDIDFKEFELHSRKLGTLQCCLCLSIYILNCFELRYWNVGPRFYIHVARNLQRLKIFMFLLLKLYVIAIILPKFLNLLLHNGHKNKKPVAIHIQFSSKIHFE